jgi:hypothetical protein
VLEPEVHTLVPQERLRTSGLKKGHWNHRAARAGTHDGDGDLMNVRFGPTCGLKSKISQGPRSANSGREQSQQGNPLIDHLVGACGEAGRHFEPEYFGSLEVDNKLELGGMNTGRIWQGRVYSRPRGRDFVVASFTKNHVRRRD